MTSNITTRDKVSNIQRLLDDRMVAIAKSLPSNIMAPDRFARAVLSLCQNTPKLLDVKPATLIGAVLQCAHLGLDPNVSMGQAYVIPYGNVAQLQIGYRGLLTLAWRSGQLAKVDAQVVREGDDFDYEFGIDPKLRHRPRAALAADVQYVYAIAKLRETQESMFNVLTREECEKVRAQSRAGRSGPWVTHWDEMAKKTALRRLCKLLPLSTEKDQPLRKAMDLDERAELGLKQHIEGIFADGNEKETESGIEDVDDPGLPNEGSAGQGGGAREGKGLEPKPSGQKGG